MIRLLLAAAAGVAVGVSVGAATTVGVTLAVEHRDMAPAQAPPAPSGPVVVQYGDRCAHGRDCPSGATSGLRP